ncbi:MAG TPA: YncE family protein [Lacunisphaera sp.]|jgi:DNA-binding beta-propeller fold protein YncE
MRAIALLALCLGSMEPAHANALKLVQTIPLSGVEGRIDHFGIDPAGDRLFVAALGNNTVEVVDLKGGKVSRTLSGFSEPQGILFVPEFNRLYVANGGDGALRVFDATTFAPVTTIKFENDADNVRYDTATKQVYVGYGSGALGVVDAEKNVLAGTIPLTGHPESFQLETNSPRIFVNVPRSHNIAVVDRVTKETVGTWSLGLVAANFPMALDQANHRAFIATRAPARLLVFDTTSGREVAKLDLHGDCDDVFYDASLHQIYASCGEGFIDVFTQIDADHYAEREAVKSAKKARTAFFSGDMLYLASPKNGETPAAIHCYEVRR